ncbi:hypothetical protein RFI_08130 [Reticulomyxa filosa]|uniref:Phosphoglycerate mutase family protein n=1 Tax=Reticulomyxa filosa TaxID=46433 RepID=X6NUR1_RETFI|nr:hypothetical protein RFI_08130 [Reticulomyxa filosa]|eukprot:ETO28997.1 hypothetical protein RFI_08130 [Reticulomyxa filosa]
MVMQNYDPGKVDTKDVAKETRKQLIVIRHAESTWNEVFNRSLDWRWPLRVLYVVAVECAIFVKNDSLFIDAPLSHVGINQAQKLQDHLFDRDSTELSTQELILRNGKGTLLVSSPLRRCIETLTVGLFPRLNKGSDKVVLLSHLQELTGNVDGMSLCGACEIPPVSTTIRTYGRSKGRVENWEEWFAQRLEPYYKQGFKPSLVRGDSRIHAFVEWLFSSACEAHANVVVSGHSLWLRHFFATFLPRDSIHPAKTYKVKNSGAIAFDFVKYEMNDGTIRYRIETDSITIVYGGFEVPVNKRL